MDQLLQPGNLILGCGIFAFIGSNPQKYFSWDKFNVLGKFNDSRGGDACGRIVGNKVEYGLDKLKEYDDFAAEVAPPILKVTSNIVMGHCRKASSGGKADMYAQPVVLYKRDLDISKIRSRKFLDALNLVEDDTIVFSGVHNGTIENYLDLATKYKIPTENHNDSRVLLSILFYGHIKVLSEYVGTAALIWHNHLTNRSFIFKGASKSYSASTSLSEERSLFAWQIGKDNYYISSMVESLKFIQLRKNPVHEIKVNTLYKFKEGVNYTSVSIDRSSCTQYKVYKNSTSVNVPATSAYRGGCNFSRRDSKPVRWYEENPIDDIFYMSEGRGELPPWTQRELGLSKKGEELVRKFSIGKYESFRLAFEKVERVSSRSLKKSIYNKTRYWMDEGLMHGVYVLTQGGIVPNYTYAKDIMILKPYYFIEGIMMDGFQAYKAALKIHEDFIETIKDDMMSVAYEEEVFTFQIAKYSRYPVIPLLNNDDREKCYTPSNNGPLPDKNYHTGSYQPLFSYRRYDLHRGELKSIQEATTQKTQNHDLTDAMTAELYIKEAKSRVPLDWVFSVGSNLLSMDTYRNPISPFQKIAFSKVDFGKPYIGELEIFMISYLRDFNYFTTVDCTSCVDEESILITNCSNCSKLRCNLEIVRNKTHGIYT